MEWQNQVMDTPGQSLSSLLRIIDNRSRLVGLTITAEASVGLSPSDAWMPRELVKSRAIDKQSPANYAKQSINRRRLIDTLAKDAILYTGGDK